MIPTHQLSRSSVALALLSLSAWWPSGAFAGSSSGNIDGYKLKEDIPVSCLNRTVDGEHITDDLGKLQYVPFVTCNETARPLSLHYGISETITCTIASLTDEMYHLLEFYVHSDVPMTCRVPTAPLIQSGSSDHTEKTKAEDAETASGEVDSLSALANNGPPFTPLTIALQGTLQRSHLHIWTDMNVVMHNMASDAAAEQKTMNGAQSGQPGFAVAGTAYSTPEFDNTGKNRQLDEDEEPVALAQAAREPWTAGHGTKVVRGEPLTFSFHVAWLEGGDSIGWPVRPSSASWLSLATGSGKGSGSFFSKLFFFLMAASVGALVAIYWERNGGRGRPAWHGDGLLGGTPARGAKGPGVTFGNGGRINGYGGYSGPPNGNGAGGGGYGLPTGKRD
ncbi:hypothetical protein PENANT_c061G08850 [Penicillium antarcticum]|uniref:Autophagy-related protein 27 n=1 Tax=Penicillium antarcticum TaxID=416450 RepID=A0A1V6PQ08_9EURO|nr:uncharacterized protein N7508_000471 [Penicillium antarcticum]KAJ5320188.1 hypothetical protein N7508_000471 [Penicillium antarcticum]OQD79130.1 hypothetical protein PENANT_c061G08850 [Penicillium antarcticum]